MFAVNWQLKIGIQRFFSANKISQLVDEFPTGEDPILVAGFKSNRDNQKWGQLGEHPPLSISTVMDRLQADHLPQNFPSIYSRKMWVCINKKSPKNPTAPTRSAWVPYSGGIQNRGQDRWEWYTCKFLGNFFCSYYFANYQSCVECFFCTTRTE